MVATILLKNYINKHPKSLAIQSLGLVATPITATFDLVTYFPGKLVNGTFTYIQYQSYKNTVAKKYSARRKHNTIVSEFQTNNLISVPDNNLPKD